MRVTLTIDKSLAVKAKAYAKKNGVSLSFVVENYLRRLLKMPLLKIKKRKKK